MFTNEAGRYVIFFLAHSRWLIPLISSSLHHPSRTARAHPLSSHYPSWPLQLNRRIAGEGVFQLGLGITALHPSHVFKKSVWPNQPSQNPLRHKDTFCDSPNEQQNTYSVSIYCLTSSQSEVHSKTLFLLLLRLLAFWLFFSCLPVSLFVSAV